MKSLIKNVVAVSALAAACGFVGSSAFAAGSQAGLIATINENTIPGTTASGLVQVNQLNGNYSEVLTVTGANTFVTSAYFNATGWTLNGNPVASVLNLPENILSSGYRIYAEFVSTGTFGIVGSSLSFNASSASIKIFADPIQNTVQPGFLTPAGVSTGTFADFGVLGGSADDVLLGTATSILTGNGNANTGQLGNANGNFEILFGNFLPAGANNGYAGGFFAAPNPFYIDLDLNGNFQSFVPTVGASTLISQSSANAFFLPEPSSVALIGLALVGLAVARRRNA